MQILKNKRGITFLQLIVTIGFFAIVSVGITTLLVQNMKLVANSQQQTQAMTMAVNKWTQLLSTPYDNVVSEARTTVGGGYDRQITVSEQTLGDGTKQKNVQITVSQTGGGSIFSLNEIKSQIVVNGGSTGEVTPSGAVMYFNLSSCPAGWVLADGTNGTNDLRGAFLRSLDLGKGRDELGGGRTLGSYQEMSFGSHFHSGSTGSAGSHSHRVIDETLGRAATGFIAASAGNPAGFTILNNMGWYHANLITQTGGGHSHTLSISATGGVETRPRNIALLTCQKQ